MNFCREFGSEDKLLCGTYCNNRCSTFSRSESGAETRPQTVQFLLDILNKNQVGVHVSTYILNLYALQHVVEFLIQAFFPPDEKVLLLPVVYEIYKYEC